MGNSDVLLEIQLKVSFALCAAVCDVQAFADMDNVYKALPNGKRESHITDIFHLRH